MTYSTTCVGKPEGNLRRARSKCSYHYLTSAPCTEMMRYWVCQVSAARANCEPGFEQFISAVAERYLEARTRGLDCEMDLDKFGPDSDVLQLFIEH